MKLLIVNTSTGWGGLEMNVVKLAMELKNRSYDIHFVCQENTTFEQKIAQQFDSILKLSKVKKYFDFKNAKIISNYLISNNINIVFSAFRPDLDLLLWTKKKVPSIKIIHQQQMQIGIPKKGIFHRWRFKAVDIWLTPLHWLKEEVLEKTNLEKNKIRIVPLGVKTELFSNIDVTRQKAQHFFNFQSDAFVLGIIGRIDEKKGQLFLVKAIKNLIDKGENINLLIVGAPTVDDPKTIIYLKEIKKYIAENNLTNEIHFASPTSEIINFYKAIDLFVMSSVGETYGMVTVEAMFAKTPVMGSNSGGTPELLNYGKRGELFEMNQIDSFEKSYFVIKNKLQKNELLLDKIQKEAIELYSFEKEIEGVEKAIKELSNAI